MTRRPIIAGNWKMNATLKEATVLTQSVAQATRNHSGVEIVLCPPFTALSTVGEVLKETGIFLGAQDVYWEAKGAYTGEISPMMLKDMGCRYCIIGHSERRQLLGETDGMIHRKLKALLENGLTAILCVGETLEVRQAGRTWDLVARQLEQALGDSPPPRLASQLVIAYEPVWAIGTGQNATPVQAQEVHKRIRSWLVQQIGESPAQGIRIQYGGSVKPENARELLSESDIDGALVGGASLEPKAFVSIVESASQAKG
jgi:triosephosphate isomerase